MPLVQTRGAASAQGFGEFAQATAVNYIEDVFSTYLYTGNSSTQTITNGIDLSTKGGLIWQKTRPRSTNHFLTDSARGFDFQLATNSSDAQVTRTGVVTPTTSGFSLNGTGGNNINYVDESVVSWTFRKQPKFFDVLTYTGNAANRTIAHNLGSVPACIIIKRTDDTSFWAVYHKDLGVDQGYVGKDFHIFLNSTNAQDGISDYWNRTAPTSTVFSLGASSQVNANGGTYVAYVFAHDAGGFGLTGTDNVISCGSYTGTGSTPLAVTLGYEPQWLLVKKSSGVANWYMQDVMRGMPISDYGANLFANLSNAEAANTWMYPTATGFAINDASANVNESGATYIYIAIRRGPMKVPTVGTSVFTPIARTGTGAAATVTGAGFPVDLTWIKDRTSAYGNQDYDRLRGAGIRLGTYGTFDEQVDTTTALTSFASMDGFSLGSDSTNIGVNRSGDNFINWCFRRAPGFFDEVCYTGNGTIGRTVTHNLNVAPELLIVKGRSAILAGYDWYVYTSFTGNANVLYLNLTLGSTSNSAWNSTTPTSTTFTLDNTSPVNRNGSDYVAYLFATCAGVSKVGSYTGNGTTQTINCGFTGGARFVLIKRTDSTGDWMVSDSARGIVSGNDPYLELNNTNAEVTGEDWLDTDSTGFVVNEVSGSNANTSSATYIFLAIA